MAKYNEIFADIQEDIASKKYTDKLPSLRELAKKYQVNQKTVSKIIQLLVSKGIVETKPKSGIRIVNLDNYPATGKTSNSIGLMVRHYGDYFSSMFHAIIDEIDKKKSVPVLVPHRPNCITNSIINELLMQKPKSIIIDNASYRITQEYLEKIAKSIPHVVFIVMQPAIDAHNCSYVLSDDYYGACLMVKHLVDLNHKRIMLLDQNVSMDALRYRYSRHYNFSNGYRAAMNEHNLSQYIQNYAIPLIENSDWLDDIKKILQSRNRPTAIVCEQDNYAILLMETALSMGLKIPEDLSIIGYFNTSLGENASVPLTSVSLKEEEIGKKAVELASKKNQGYYRIVVLPELIIRKSTAIAKTQI